MVVWIVIFILVVLISVFITAYLLPRIYLKQRYTVEKSDDRCIKRVYERNGQSLVFEPEEKWRKIVHQYVLSERGENKVLMCKVNKSLSYIEFDVVVFNAFNQVAGVIKVNDYVDGSGYTKIVELPDDTSYISINVIRADNEKFGKNITAKVPAKRKFGFIMINAVMILVEVIACRICLANIFGDEFRESIVLNLEGAITSAIIAGVLILINTIIVMISVKVREKNNTVKVEKDA